MIQRSRNDANVQLSPSRPLESTVRRMAKAGQTRDQIVKFVKRAFSLPERAAAERVDSLLTTRRTAK